MVLLTLAIVPAPAEAANPSAPQLVTRAGDTALLARDDGEQICVLLKTGRSTSDACAPGAVVVGLEALPADPQYVGVAVPATATRVELRRAGRLVVGAPTAAAGAYTGRRAGALRFALVALPAGMPTEGLRVRALDAADGLVLVLAPTDSKLFTGRRTVLSGRVRGVSWQLTGSQSSDLAPSVLDVSARSAPHAWTSRSRSGAWRKPTVPARARARWPSPRCSAASPRWSSRIAAPGPSA